MPFDTWYTAHIGQHMLFMLLCVPCVQQIALHLCFFVQHAPDNWDRVTMSCLCQGYTMNY